MPFDLLVSIPLHGGPAYVGRSPGLGDELGFVATDPHTLQAKAAANVFAIGDATNVPTSKAGSVTHFEGDTLVANIAPLPRRRAAGGTFDGHANCFIETGFHKALLIDFNYDVEPLPGRFPEPHLGPLPLLKESRLNHMAKLAFQWVYWHMLLPGRDMPGHQLATATRRQGHQPARDDPRRTTMTPDTLEGTPIELDAEGFFQRPEQWTREMAGEHRRGERHRRAHRPPLAGHRLHAHHLPRDRHRHRRSARSGRPPASRSRSSTSSSPRGRRSSPPRSPASPSPAAASKETTMTEILDQPLAAATEQPKTIEKVAIVISKGSLEGIYPGLIMANGARMEGIEANVFFTFFGLDAIRKDRQAHIKVATVGNPGMHIPTLLGALPGMSAMATRMMQRQMEKLDIPPIGEFVEMISDSGAGLYACKATRRHVQADRAGLHRAGRRGAHRRRVLRARRRWRDHLHLRRPPRRARRSRRSSATGLPSRASTASRGPI